MPTRINLEIDTEAVERLVEQGELTLNNCSSTDQSGKSQLRALFLHALKKKLNIRQVSQRR